MMIGNSMTQLRNSSRKEDERMSETNNIQGGIMVCHPPLILPNIGRGEEKKIAEITAAYKQAADEIRKMDPDTIVIVSPHAPSYMDYIQLSKPAVSKGNMAQFRDPMDSFVIHNDLELVDEMEKLAKAEGFPMGTLGVQNGDLDHGTMVPLYFIQDLLKDKKVVRMGIGGLSNLDHYHAGEILAKAADKLGRKVAVIASGDLSHCQKADSSYGYKPCGPAYDKEIMEIMGNGDFLKLVEMPEKEAEDAMVCGHKPFCVMAGSFDGLKPDSKALAHSAEFGVGYGIATYTDLKEDPSRHFYEKASADKKAAWQKRLAKEDPYIKLARDTINAYIKEGMMPPLPDHLPEELYSTRAGAFVSLHEDGQLRGCIGTTEPTQKNLGREIQMNAVSACSRDPRFYPVRPDELDKLEISVDVLKKPEPCTLEDLDPQRYGVIVSKNGKRGLLLPHLDGVDTVEQQVSIAKQKAGLKADEPGCSYERFEVIRHEV